MVEMESGHRGIDLLLLFELNFEKGLLSNKWIGIDRKMNVVIFFFERHEGSNLILDFLEIVELVFETHSKHSHVLLTCGGIKTCFKVFLG